MSSDPVKQYLARIGRKGGKATSDDKAAAARENGAKGGRPKSLEKARAKRWPKKGKK